MSIPQTPQFPRSRHRKNDLRIPKGQRELGLRVLRRDGVDLNLILSDELPLMPVTELKSGAAGGESLAEIADLSLLVRLAGTPAA